jgi:hypothetical protein
MSSHTRQGYKKGTTSQRYNTRAHFGSAEFLFYCDEITTTGILKKEKTVPEPPYRPCAQGAIMT